MYACKEYVENEHRSTKITARFLWTRRWYQPRSIPALGVYRGEDLDLKGLLHPEFVHPELYLGTYVGYIFSYLSLRKDACS